MRAAWPSATLSTSRSTPPRRRWAGQGGAGCPACIAARRHGRAGASLDGWRRAPPGRRRWRGRRSWVQAPPAPPAWYIRRTIKPALGSMQVRKVRGPLLDTLYARLMRSGNLACTGKPFTEHRHILDLRPDPAAPRVEWQQAADCVRAAIRSGQLASGDTLPSVPDLARLQGLKPGTVRHAYLALAEEGLVHIHHGRTTTIAGDPAADKPGTRLQLTRPHPGHDCKLSGCRSYVCKPMAKSIIQASTASCREPSRRRCGGSGPTATRFGRRSRPPSAVRPSWLLPRKPRLR